MVVKMQNQMLNNSSNNRPLWLNNFVSVYQTLSTDNLDLLSNIYHTDVTFIDPMHKVEGLDDLDLNLYKGNI